MSEIPDEHRGALYHRYFDDGLTEVAVYPMTFGKARVCVGLVGDGMFTDGWCYERAGMAIEAAKAWDGEGDPPDGWHRQLSTGRRRTDGDPEQEYVRR
jgi:hypothetical protein